MKQVKGLTEVPGAVKELQGFTLSLLAGANANTKINVAALRQRHTLLAALNNNAGTITDILSTITVEELKASGTLTCAAVVAGDTCVVNGVTYTAAAAPANATEFKVEATNNAQATTLAKCINDYENRYAGSAQNVAAVVATVVNAVVTIKAKEEGTAGNAIVLTGTAVRLAASGAGVLAGGSATGGIKSSGATNQVLLFWLNN